MPTWQACSKCGDMFKGSDCIDLVNNACPTCSGSVSDSLQEFMAKAFTKDPDLFRRYQDNIAMLLHDNYGITDYEKRNNAAIDILKLIFK